MVCQKTHCVEVVRQEMSEWLKFNDYPCAGDMVDKLLGVAGAVMRHEQLIPAILDLNNSSLRAMVGCPELNEKVAVLIMRGLRRFIESLVECWGGMAVFGQLKYSEVPTLTVEIQLEWGTTYMNWAVDYINGVLRLTYFHFESRC